MSEIKFYDCYGFEDTHEISQCGKLFRKEFQTRYSKDIDKVVTKSMDKYGKELAKLKDSIEKDINEQVDNIKDDAKQAIKEKKDDTISKLKDWIGSLF